MEVGHRREPDIDPCLEKSLTEFDHCRDLYILSRRVAIEVVRSSGSHETVPSASIEFVDIKPIGSRSTFSQVHSVQEKGTGIIYARKEIACSAGASSLTSPEAVMKEIGIMQKLSHHHIATLAFASKDDYGFKLYISPCAKCDLGHYLDLSNDQYRYDKDQALQWFGCLLAALDYAHRNKVKHSDIKPENILIDDEGKRVLLTDFGLSRDFSNHENSMSVGTPPRGTNNYFAPECLSDKGKRTIATDIFALGCVFTEMLGAMEGFSRETYKQQRKKWNNERSRGGEHFWGCLDKIKGSWLNNLKGRFPDEDENGTPLIIVQTKRMLTEEAEDRPSASSVLLHLKDAKYQCNYCSR